MIKEYIKKFIITAAIMGAGASIIFYIAFSTSFTIFFTAYLIGFVLIGSNLLLLNKIGLGGGNHFLRWFMGSLVIRFIGAIMTVLVGIKILNSHEILFTVSFIFSYLCHSVIEIFYLNSYLKTDAKL